METSKGHGIATSLARKPVAYRTFTQLKQTLGISEFRHALVLERARTDRSEQEFSLLLLEGSALSSGDLIGQVMRELSGRIRTVDVLGWFDHGRLAILLPDTPSRGAFELAKDIQHVTRSFSLRLTTYTYPGEWLPEDEDDRSNSGEGPGVFAGSIDRLFHRPLPAWKRTVDLTVSAIALILLSPLFAAIAATIKIVSRGPVFLRQERIGYQGRPFKIWKFRTMKIGADTSIHQEHFEAIMASDMPLTKLDTKGDPRIIRFGNFMRRCYLDEIPQLINVLRGDMSLVGPRPCLGFAVSRYRPWQRMRCDAVPGMTGLWQVSGKNSTTFKEMIRLDIRYLRRRSFGFDMTIVLKTVPAIFKELIEARKRGQRS